MIKNTIFFCSLFLIPVISFAQRPGRNFSLAFTVSPTFGWMEINHTGDQSYKPYGTKAQSSYGILGDFGFDKNYFFSSGFTLTTIGSRMHVSLPGGTQDIDYNIQYVEVPLTLKLKTNANKIRFYGQFGLDGGVKVSNKHTLTALDIRTNANTFRLGLLAGSGVEWHLSQSTNVLTGASYNRGFTNVFSNPDTKNSFIALNIGVFF